MVLDTGTLTSDAIGDRAGKGIEATGTEKENTEKIGTETDKNDSGDAKEVKETKDKDKTRSVSFNRDVHVKRFGKPRESRGSSADPFVRKEPFTHLSKQQLIEEANKVREQADNITCTSDHPPEKFFSLPHRKKHKDDRDRRNSDDSGTPDGKSKLGRSTSDASARRKERTSLSTLFRRAQKKTPPLSPVAVTTKPVVIVKRSKSDVSDLKSNNNLNTPIKPIRKRSGSESEEFLKSLRNKKAQLSPIIESSPRDDYFRKTPPLEAFQKKISNEKVIKPAEEKILIEKKVPIETKKVNPIEKPPRYKSPDKVEPKPPVRTKRGKSAEKVLETSPKIAETPKRKTDVKKTLLVDEIDSFKTKDLNPVDVKGKIKESIRKLEENIYGHTDMIHSSQQPTVKPPLTRGHTVDHIVRKLKEDSRSPPPASHLLSGSHINVNQPFSYTKPSVSPDPNLFARTTSPDRIPTPVNKMNSNVFTRTTSPGRINFARTASPDRMNFARTASPDRMNFARTTSPEGIPSPTNNMNGKGVVYAHVVRDSENGSRNLKQTVHKTYSPNGKYGHFSDEDEGLGYEERNKYSASKYNNYNSNKDGPTITDSPIRPRFREYKLTSFDDFQPTYANEYHSMKDPIQDYKKQTHDYIDTFRGRGDGMDTKKKVTETDKDLDLEFNELSHRRQLLESRLNARIFDRIPAGEPVSRYLAEADPIYEANKRMKATEKYVNETAKYIHHTLERDGFTERTETENYDKYDSDNHRVKYNTHTRTYEKLPEPVDEVDRREYLDTLEPRYKDDLEPRYKGDLEPRYKDGRKVFPPEPEYEPPSLESIGKPILTPDEYVEKKYRVKKFISSHDVQKYKGRDGNDFGKRKGHYASNPEIAQEREEDYANIRNDAKQVESYHNSLRRVKNKDKYKQDYPIKRHDSGDSQDYYRENTPRRFDIDNRLVDSGIENDFRKSSGEIHGRKYESDEDVRNTSLLLHSERRHTDDNYPSEQIYTNGEYVARFKDFREDYNVRESGESRADLKGDRYKSPSDEKVSAKPPKAKKLSGLEKVKQLFSRDSSKKSKKEKEVQPMRTRVLKSPEHLARDDSEYKRYTDPEPSDVDTIKKGYDPKEERRYRRSREDIDRHRSSREDIGRSSGEDVPGHKSSREDLDTHRTSREDIEKHRSPRDVDRDRSSREHLDRHRNSREHGYKSSKDDVRHKSSDPRDSDLEKRYRVPDFDKRYERTVTEDRRHVERHEAARRYNSSDRDSDHHRPSDTDSERRKTRSRTAAPLDSPALAERYRERRRLATPSPTPSPPRPPVNSTGNWFKSLDRLTRKKKNVKVEKEAVQTDNESTRKVWTKPTKPLNSPAKNLRFFGDTDHDSDSNYRPVKPKTLPVKPHAPLRKTVSNSSTGVDEIDHELTNKSYSLTNLHKDDSPGLKYYKRNLQNISEIQSNSEVESHADRKASLKPPISPYDRSRSHSSSKTLKASKSDLRRHRNEDRGSSSELRGSKLDLKSHRRRATGANSGESSTEGDSRDSHQSQRSVVYLHATTVGDIPDPGHLSRNRSRDDVSSVNSSNLQVRNTTKTFSIFAPWTPKLHPDHHDLHYNQKPRRSKPRELGSNKTSSTRNLAEDRPSTLQKNKSYSQTTLTRKPQNSRLTSSSTTLYRKPEKKTRENSSVISTTLSRDSRRPNGNARVNKKSQSSEVLTRDGDRERISRSISMPKDKIKKAGWFGLAPKNKKQETRVR